MHLLNLLTDSSARCLTYLESGPFMTHCHNLPYIALGREVWLGWKRCRNQNGLLPL